MENHNNIPTISIVGRPNVGKSSLFNRLMRERRAVVVEQSGTTRDRVEAVVTLEGYKVRIVDTGGYLLEDKDKISMQVKDQIASALEESSLIVFVTDTASGISPADKEVADLVRRASKPVILVANKTDNHSLEDDSMEFFQLGFGEPLPVSCLHRRGLRRFRSQLGEMLKELPKGEHSDQAHALKVAVVGRPNVGKSSFINNILDRKRVIVSDIPGTTRDSIDTFFNCGSQDYILIDTAGIRHKRKIKTAVDTYSIMRSKGAIQRADVVILILDAADGLTKDDVGILRFVYDNGKACLIAVNKWDLTEEAEVDVTQDEYEKHLVYATSQAGKFPVTFISAETGENVLETLSIAQVLDANLDLEVSTPSLNKLFEKNDPANIPIPRRKKRPNFLYIVQSRKRPVEFKFFVNDPSAVLPAHLSYIENQLRSNFPLKGIPIKILLRRSKKEKK